MRVGLRSLGLMLFGAPFFFWLGISLPAAAKEKGPAKVVIAHRGASGYLPEHTLPAVAMAYALGADFIEPDLVLTKDGVPVVVHDIHLEATTNVATVFPARKRADGRWYAIDFTLAEVKQLSVGERRDVASGAAVFPTRFPVDAAIFQVPTLEEEILLVQGLNRSTGRQVGLYPELKSPAFHTKEGQDIAVVVLGILAKHGYSSHDALLYLQCFDPATLKRIRHELKSPLKLVQLVADNAWKEADFDFDAMRTEAGIKEVATYADGLGPSLQHLFSPDPKHPKDESRVVLSGLSRWAKAAGLTLHPYTLRADQLPPWASTYDKLVQRVFVEAGADGAFSDFTDRAVAALKARHLR